MARPRSDVGPRIVHAARERFLKEGVDGASLRAAVIGEANLEGADLRQADLRDVDLSGAVLVYCDLRGARLSGADLSATVSVGSTDCISDTTPATCGVAIEVPDRLA